MFHSMFYYGVNGSAPTTYPFRYGDFTVNGSYSFRRDTGTESNFLLDSTAQSAVGSSDFVLVTCCSTTNDADSPLLNNSSNMRFDLQGDSGSGSLITGTTSTTTAKNVVWSTNSGNSGGGNDVNRDDDFGGVGLHFPLCIPASLFGTSDSTRTGRVAVSSSASSEIIIDLVFCSWSSNTDSLYRPGNFTVNGGYYLNAGGIQDNYLFDNALETAVSTSDFVMVTWATTSNNSITIGYFDCQGDGGSGSLLAPGVGTTTAGNAVWKTGPHSPLYLPISLFGTSNSTRTGRRIGSANAPLWSFIVCNWGT